MTHRYYRKLEVGEVIQAGDMYLSGNKMCKTQVGGCAIRDYCMLQYFRPVDTPPSQWIPITYAVPKTWPVVCFRASDRVVVIANSTGGFSNCQQCGYTHYLPLDLPEVKEEWREEWREGWEKSTTAKHLNQIEVLLGAKVAEELRESWIQAFNAGK